MCEREKVAYVPDGLEAIVFTADGDMRQALNNLQATSAGFGLVSGPNVFKVCDQPHPLLVARIVSQCAGGQLEDAAAALSSLSDVGYSAMDIITTLFKVTRGQEALSEYVKLEYLREIGFTHMRITEGVNSRLQLAGLLARMVRLAAAHGAAGGG